MEISIIFIILITVVIYTLYYTYFFDKGMFLFIIILILFGLWVAQFVNDKISGIETNVKNTIDKQIDNLKNISTNLLSDKIQNFMK